MAIESRKRKQRGFCLDMMGQGDKLKAALRTGKCAASGSTLLIQGVYLRSWLLVGVGFLN